MFTFLYRFKLGTNMHESYFSILAAYIYIILRCKLTRIHYKCKLLVSVAFAGLIFNSNS